MIRPDLEVMLQELVAENSADVGGLGERITRRELLHVWRGRSGFFGRNEQVLDYILKNLDLVSGTDDIMAL